MKKAFIPLILLFALAASARTATPTATPTAEAVGYTQIDAEEAKRIMDTETEYILLDVRTQAEYETGHIPGAVVLPDNEVAMRAGEVLPDTDALVLVYCRSGRRSKLAAETLAEMGYTNVMEFGGIMDWPYDIEP